MTRAAEKGAEKTPANGTRTAYAILLQQPDGDWRDVEVTNPIQASSASHAIKLWAESAGDSITLETVRAIPKSRITEMQVKVETRRQLTLAAP